MQELIFLNITVQYSYFLHVFYIGGLSTIAFFILFLFYKSKEKIYFYYFLFLILSIIIGVLNISNSSINAQLALKNYKLTNRILEPVTLLALYVYCIFTIYFLNLKKINKALTKWIRILASLTFLYSIIYFILYPYIQEYSIIFFAVSRIVIFIMSIIAIFWIGFKIKTKYTNFFIIGSLFYFLGALIASVRLLYGNEIGINLFTSFNANSYFIMGILLEVLCFSLGLNYRVVTINKIIRDEIEEKKNIASNERDDFQLQILALRLQSDAHFIFNNLNSIKYQIQSNQNNLALNSINLYSKFLRKLFESSKKKVINLQEEFDIIKNYLLLESERFNKKISLKINAENNISLHDIMVPPLLIQPYIEYSVWLGLNNYDNNSYLIEINFRKERSYLLINIENKKNNFEIEDFAYIERAENPEFENKHLERYNLYKRLYNKTISSYVEYIRNEEYDLLATKVVLKIEYA
ncbi:MAG TPA: 7TM diverse intracellular signaling domain-containing protein [Chitinophagaceae bacterium]|nr:7TM diverse intracellular signaling domain-containing protein [Chitinophagaceae bacterium]